jgi:CTP-dependent riboflavin kinase
VGETMNVDAIRAAADYQQFDFDARGRPIELNARISAKLEAMSDMLPPFEGRRVLDLGCDMGAWSFLAAAGGAAAVVGVDRNRNVRGVGDVDLCELNRQTAERYELYRNTRFRRMEMGRQWHELGRFDLVLMMSVYHHVYQAAGGDHAAIWYWLARHVEPGGVLLWEGPTDCEDVVSDQHISEQIKREYNPDAILDAASEHFDLDGEAPALHEETRTVFRFVRRALDSQRLLGELTSTSGGATRAFLHAGSRRMLEIHDALGFMPYPGSLNVQLEEPFDFATDYYRARLLDVVDRRQGLEGEWAERWCRFYPLRVDAEPAFAMRFEGDRYSGDFLELVAPCRLRDRVGTTVEIERTA